MLLRTLALLLALSTNACMTFVTIPLTVPAAADADAALTCAMSKAVAVGFRTTSADLPMRFANLERPAAATGTSVIGGFKITDYVSITTTTEDSAGAVLRIQRYAMQSGGAGKPAGPHTRLGPTDATELDVFQIMRQCGEVADSTVQRVRAEFAAKGRTLP